MQHDPPHLLAPMGSANEALRSAYVKGEQHWNGKKSRTPSDTTKIKLATKKAGRGK